MEARRPEHWRMVKPRRQNGWTLRLVVAFGLALLFLSSGFARMLPTDSMAYLRRSRTRERNVMARDVARNARRSEMRGRILDEVEHVDGGKGAEDDMTGDYSTPTHNQSSEDPSPPDAKSTSRHRTPQQFSRYTARYGHRHLRGV